MQVTAILRILGVLLMVFSLTMLPPVLVEYYYHDGALWPFIFASLLTVITGFCLWFPCRKQHRELKNRDGFLIVVLFWTVLSLFASLPFLFLESFPLSFTDAMFEASSGLTTTGTSILSHIDSLPHAILYYRQQLQFLGGMGIIVLAVAILPMLGVGGMQLYRAETPGPIKDAKLTPRITETAKTLWYIYLGLTVACMFLYWAAGMNFFDAVGESFSTVSTGGFSPHDASFGYYKSPLIHLIAVLFMFFGAVNFGLHYAFLSQRNLLCYWRDKEFRMYLSIIVTVSLIAIITLAVYHVYPIPEAFINGLFMVVSLSTTTGFTNSNFSQWPTFLPYMIMLFATIGGCAASTAGGMKVVRIMLLQNQALIELQRLIHPKAVLPIRLGEQRLPDHIIHAIWGFVTVFVSLFVLIILLLLATGLDFTSAFGSAAACLSNAGASIGSTAVSFKSLTMFAKWVLIFAMFAGRLEIFTILLLFMPAFWRR